MIHINQPMTLLGDKSNWLLEGGNNENIAQILATNGIEIPHFDNWHHIGSNGYSVAYYWACCRPMPKSFTDFDSVSEEGGNTVAHTLAEYNHLPEGFDRWDIANVIDGDTVAGIAAVYDNLPEDFDDWELNGIRDKNVAEVWWHFHEVFCCPEGEDVDVARARHARFTSKVSAVPAVKAQIEAENEEVTPVLLRPLKPHLIANRDGDSITLALSTNLSSARVFTRCEAENIARAFDMFKCDEEGKLRHRHGVGWSIYKDPSGSTYALSIYHGSEIAWAVTIEKRDISAYAEQFGNLVCDEGPEVQSNHVGQDQQEDE